MGTVVVAGAVANKMGSGGEAWVRLSWVRGLQRLGHDVRFVEELAGDQPAAVKYFRDVVDRFGLAEVATLLVDGEAAVGPGAGDIRTAARPATLVNISGHLAPGPLFDAFRARVFVDIDPGFTQFWHTAGDAGAKVDGHDLHFTIGENIGTPDCPIPTAGIMWRPVRQPVVLADWPVTPSPAPRRFTTVANWRGPFGAIEYDGRRYGLKLHEFRKFMTLPRRSGRAFEMALNIHPAEERDLLALDQNGWLLVEPGAVAGNPERFRAYVQGSAAEFSVAQGVYVDTRSGWFSDRTVRYLASGKPALVQDTGFTRSVPAGAGLLGFTTLDEAVAGAETIMDDYESHAAAARAVAEDYFDSDVVLTRFCEQAGIS